MNLILACAIVACFTLSGPETDLLAEVNRARAAQGVAELAFNAEVSRLAEYRSEEMASLHFFCTRSRIYGEPDEMLVRFGVPFDAVGVNIAKGQDTAEEVLQAWLSSPRHTENLLNAKFTSAGVGLSCDDGIPVWTLFLIGDANQEFKYNGTP
ncbi:MAG: CAP domain-containing protein [Defluviitaleaceae bacterium]|nr:CAP domain-containing protein [Defluviitaleaceae bacterium]